MLYDIYIFIYMMITLNKIFVSEINTSYINCRQILDKFAHI